MEFDYKKSQLDSWDFVVIAVYFVSIFVVGIWSSRGSRWSLRSCRKSKVSPEVGENGLKSDVNVESENQSDDGPVGESRVGSFFLASRTMHWLPVGGSLFASNIGSEHFIGLAGSAAASGIAIATYELNAIFILMILGWLFVPVYHAAGVYTMPEYLVKRFGRRRIQIFLSILALLFYVFTKISADLYAGALFIKFAMGFAGQSGLYIAILILLFLAATFCIAGGLSAVIWTDFVQTILMVTGAIVLMIMAFSEVGGYQSLVELYAVAEPSPDYSAYEWDPVSNTNRSCGRVHENFLHFFHPANDDFLPWTGVISGMFIASLYYWCTDQVIVQRLLAAKNLSHAKGGTLMAGTLKILPLFMLVFPGMAARILFPDQVACSDPEKCEEICGSEKGCSNIAYVFLVLKLMPEGLRGLMLAVMLAALMSSLTSIFNSSSTIFTMDIWSMIRNNATPIEKIIVGRVFVVILVLLSMAWIPIINSFSNSQLFVYIQAVSNFLTPPVAATFLLAIFWHRTTEPGAFWGLMVGFSCGIIRLALEFSYTVPPCGSGLPDPRPEFVKIAVGDLHYLHFGMLNFILTAILTIVISKLTKPIELERLYRLTFWTRHSTLPRKDWNFDDSGSESDDEQISETGLFRKILFFVCFVTKKDIEDDQRHRLSRQERKERDIMESVEFFKESKLWRSVCNIYAIGLISAASFLYGFYA